MKFPSLPRLLPGEDPTDKLNQWASYIEQFAHSVTFADNFEQIVTTKTLLLNSSVDISLASIAASDAYKVELISMATVSYPEINLVGATVDWKVNNTTKTVTITPRIVSFMWNGDGEPPVRDQILVNIAVQIVGVE